MLSKLDHRQAIVLLVDIQEKLLPAMHEGAACLAAAEKLLGAAKILEVPVVATEQYPEGLGGTCASLAALLPEKPISKLMFTACVPATLAAIRAAGRRRQVIVCGVEAHVCVQQTALDLLRAEMEVWVCADAVSSRRVLDRDMALQRMRQGGAIVTTVESVIYEMLGAAGTDTFKRILRIVK